MTKHDASAFVSRSYSKALSNGVPASVGKKSIIFPIGSLAIVSASPIVRLPTAKPYAAASLLYLLKLRTRSREPTEVRSSAIKSSRANPPLRREASFQVVKRRWLHLVFIRGHCRYGVLVGPRAR
eukprot:GEMP01089543.1.p1 GENE.GEMP01089543.1~~GEMP01089543.1.p1  ORF type:complete len:125 (-),score=16.57 GEMP01089543.1:201-575(-)